MAHFQGEESHVQQQDKGEETETKGRRSSKVKTMLPQKKMESLGSVVPEGDGGVQQQQQQQQQ